VYFAFAIVALWKNLTQGVKRQKCRDLFWIYLAGTANGRADDMLIGGLSDATLY
jgi:hypothetical protein